MFMQSFASQTYALMRIVTGLLFLWHGTQKLFSFPSAMPFEAPTFILYVAGPIELFGGRLRHVSRPVRIRGGGLRARCGAWPGGCRV